MREAIRNSGDAGRECVEAYERRRAQTVPQPDAAVADAPAEGENAMRVGGDATEQPVDVGLMMHLSAYSIQQPHAPNR